MKIHLYYFFYLPLAKFLNKVSPSTKLLLNLLEGLMIISLFSIELFGLNTLL